MKTKIITLIVIVIFLLSCASEPLKTSSAEYWPNSTCKNCHTKVNKEHSESHHAQSFVNPAFQGQYFNELLPLAGEKPELLEEAMACTACHAPVAYLKNKGHIVGKEEVAPELTGVPCDFCHTITGYSGKVPGNGNYISEPSDDRKLGPYKRFQHEYNWHHIYSELQTKSEFCGICHNQVNHNGLEIKSTYSEWKNSKYASEGIQCQNCHMNLLGFLSPEGKPIYESGKAAEMTLAPYRSRLYSHRFCGAHCRVQIVGAGVISLGVQVGKLTVSPGDELTVTVFVNNEKTGHKMPSGSADLRQLWLELEASVGNNIIPIPVALTGTETYDVAGKGKLDKEILGNDILAGSRIYRAIFVDATGEQTLSSYNAVKIIFDNRLNPAEIRKETYRFRVPKDAKDKIVLHARLNYLPYPSSFSNRFGLEKPILFEVASSEKTIAVR